MNDLPSKPPSLDELIEFGKEMLARYPDDFALRWSLACLEAHRDELMGGDR